MNGIICSNFEVVWYFNWIVNWKVMCVVFICKKKKIIIYNLSFNVLF